MSLFRLVHQDEDFVVIEKPAGFHVHPPEDPSIRIGKGENAMALLRDQLGRYVYPVHRIDRGTSGLVIFALNPESASVLSRQFAAREVRKIYAAACRGWPSRDSFTIASPLENSLDESGPELEAETRIEVISRVRVDQPIGKYPETRFSLVWAEPKTGRTHQIRRHLRREGHPLLGDSVHGDGNYNRWVRESFDGKNHLFLKAYGLRFHHPRDGRPIVLQSKWTYPWHALFDLAGVVPWRAFAK